MNAAEMQQLVDASVADALAAKDQEIANAIAEGLRTYADRPVGEKGAPSLQFGVVEQVNDTYAYVTLDGQTDAVPINMLGGLVEGERVAVLMVPPSGNLAIGMVTPSTPSPGVPPGGTTGQVLTKQSNADFDDIWADVSGGSSGLYGGSANTTVATATNTNLNWPTHSSGATLLDLSTITIPTVLTDGTYTFDFTVHNNGVAGGGIVIELAAIGTDGAFTGLAGDDLVTINAVTVTVGFSLTSFLHAGSTIVLSAEQTSGGPVVVDFVSVTVTKVG